MIAVPQSYDSLIALVAIVTVDSMTALMLTATDGSSTALMFERSIQLR